LAGEARRVFLRRFGVEGALEDGLDRDLAVQPRVHAFVDDAHRALAEDALDVVTPDFLQVGGLGHGWGLSQGCEYRASHCCSANFFLPRLEYIGGPVPGVQDRAARALDPLRVRIPAETVAQQH